MKRWTPGRAMATVGVSALVWAAVACACLMVGSTGVGWPTRDQLRFGRVDSVLMASLVGAALAAAGVVYQAVLRNPLADPYLLGVSSGASLFAYLWQFGFATAMTMRLGSGGEALSQQASSFIGAAITVAAVFAISSRRGRIEPVTLLLVGVIVNAVNASLFLLLNAIRKDQPAGGGPLMMLVGGIHTTLGREQMVTAAVLVGGGWLALMYLSGALNVASVSEAEAEALGVRIHRLRWLALGAASLVVAAGVAVSGPIGFVGLVCPHVARLMVGRDVRRLLPVGTAVGAGLLAVADAASRFLVGPGGTMLPVGVLTGLMGGPFFLWMLYRSRREGGMV